MVNYIRLFRGYVTIRVSGFMLQRFLNLCSVHNIALWDIASEEDDIKLKLSVSDYFRLKPIAKKTKTKVVLLEKRGLPFCMQKWKKRKVFIGCSILCALSLYILSLFVWDIRLVNEGQLTQEMLLSFLQDYGVGYGSYKKEIDIDGIEKRLRDEFPFLVWTSVRMEGTCLFVEIKENEQTVQVKQNQESEPCDLIATVSGKVVSIVTRRGIPQVKIGDEVKQGDVLVVGEVPIYNDDETIKEYMYVASDADVRLETKLHYEKKLPLEYEKKHYTGNKKREYYVRIYKNSFSTGKIPAYEEYDIVTELKQGKILHDFYLPIYFGTITYQEYVMETYFYKEKEAGERLEKEFQKFCKTLEQKGVQIVEKNVKIEKNGRTMHADGTILVEMSDGEPRLVLKKKQTGETKLE